MTMGQGGYASAKTCFAALATAADEEVSDDDSAATIETTINSHMANLSAQTAASLDANATKINTSLQQLATTNAHLQQQQQLMMQQMAMLTTNAAATRNNPRHAPPMQIYAAPPVPSYQQQPWAYPVRSDG